ncbi:MAG: Signal peptidase I W [Firmicutes bacterium ADurb.Bin300]|nr:MAG: Signal peptidase I W [Firmicutes bacterium ADurb.Bin300]
MRKKASVISTAIMIVLLVAAATVVTPRIFGIKIYPIAGDDMLPLYSKGDAVYTRSEDFEEIRAGDIISFVKDESLLVVTQRVYDVDRENRCFITKGEDRQASGSNTVLYENVLGVVKFSVPRLGYVLAFTNQTAGKITVIAIITIFALLSIVIDTRGKRKKNKQEQENENEQEQEQEHGENTNQ